MDVLTGLLDGPRADGAFLLRSVMAPPWAVRIEDECPLSLIAVVRGDAWLAPDDGEPVRLTAGDIALARGPDPYTMADRPETPPLAIIGPGQVCHTVDGHSLAQSMALGVRSWGNDPDGDSVLLVGTYEDVSATGRRLLDALPSVVVLPRGGWDNPLVSFLADEITRDEPGQGVVLDRLLDLLVVTALRAWFAQPDAEAPRWYRAQADPIVGPALRLLHDEPARRWTVAELARQTGASRAGFARRFTELVGEPPMAFLTGWRLDLAADLLRRPDTTVGSVASQVGYSSPFALSTAFKRVRGVSPHQHRQGRGRAQPVA